MYDITNKKCPFKNKTTAGIGARAYTECKEADCRFQGGDGRCMIIENHETLARLERKIDAMLKAMNLRL
jgi:hypothetical protein